MFAGDETVALIYFPGFVLLIMLVVALFHAHHLVGLFLRESHPNSNCNSQQVDRKHEKRCEKNSEDC